MGKAIKRIILVLALMVFLFSAGVVLVVKHQYQVSDRLYGDAAEQFVSPAAPLSADVQAVEAQPPQESGEVKEEPLPEFAPIAVDFAALREVNPEIVGWIFCPDTVINYPIAHGEDDDWYLHHSYNNAFNASGTIFVEAENRGDFSDVNTILYGHHMNDNSMFATLDRWQDQSYYEGHPVMWLLTPEQDYKIELFSAYHTAAYSDTFMTFPGPGAAFTEYLKVAKLYSQSRMAAQPDPDGHYVLLSTCAYVFDSARSVIHGRLCPVSSAGGVPFSNMD